MKAKAIIQKLGAKLLGQKVKMPVQIDPPDNAATVLEFTPGKTVPVLIDKLGTIHLHQHWKN